MAPTAGWYDDPRDASGLRYWDGEAWTEHVAPRQQPPPPSEAPAQYPGAPPTANQTWDYGRPTPQPGQPAPGSAASRLVTSDGAQVTTWVKRFAARLLDTILVFLASLPLTGYLLYRSFQAVSDQMSRGTNSAFSPPQDFVTWWLSFIAVFIAVELCYETFFLRRSGATPGKRALDISVRTWDSSGQLAWSTIVRRVGFIYGLAAISLVPVIGILASLAGLVDYLWPLRDPRRQALHDKVAATVVIEGARRGSL
ncbi:MAG: RDD family protein [Nocardioidaceae bacterium]